MKKIIYTLLLFFLCITGVSAKEITVHLFYSDTCPHCAKEKEYLSEFVKNNSNVKVKTYEVTKNKENSKILDLVKETFNCENNYVPYTVIGEIGLTGYSDNIASQIEHFVDKYQTEEYRDVVEEVIKTGKKVNIENSKEKEKQEKELKEEKIDIPVFGKIDPKKVSLPLVSIVIGFIDGFNPCAMWVLIFLISMLLGMQNRKKMWALGLTFLLTSALIYLLFMMAWLKITIELSSIVYIRIGIALVALIGGIINIRSYIKTRNEEVGCVVTNSEQRKKTAKKIQKITSEKKFIFALLGIMALAVSVNFVELACSAGLPVVFTQILALNKLSGIEYAIYILLYILFYLLDDIVIFVIAMVSLKVTGITNKYNKLSHLIGGILMILIGILMIFFPNILMFNF